MRPTFRPDLIAKPISVGGLRLFELCDPGTGRALRFTEDGYSIAYLLDGTRTLAQIREDFFAQRGIRISEDKLARLLEQLELMGCLVSDPNLTVPYNALKTVALPILGDGGVDEGLATVALGAEAFKDYYTIVPDGPALLKDLTKPGKKVAPRAPAVANASSRVKPGTRRAPPPIPAKSKPLQSDPTLPPLPAWPPLENAIRRSQEQKLRPVQHEPPRPAHEQLAPLAFRGPELARRYPRASAQPMLRKRGLANSQALWLAGGFLAAAFVWAFWALSRVV